MSELLAVHSVEVAVLLLPLLLMVVVVFVVGGLARQFGASGLWLVTATMALGEAWPRVARSRRLDCGAAVARRLSWQRRLDLVWCLKINNDIKKSVKKDKNGI